MIPPGEKAEKGRRTPGIPGSGIPGERTAGVSDINARLPAYI